MSFQEILKNERVRQGLTYRELSRRAGCSDRVIYYYETGKHEPTLWIADALLRALGVRMIIGKDCDDGLEN